MGRPSVLIDWQDHIVRGYFTKNPQGHRSATEISIIFSKDLKKEILKFVWRKIYKTWNS